MNKIFLNFKNNVFLKRINVIKTSLFSYALAGIFDLVLIQYISQIFTKITMVNFQGNIFFYISLCLFFIFVRTISVFYLRKIAFKNIFLKKREGEKFLVKDFIKKRTKNLDNYDEDLNLFKEKLVNSSNLAAVNFDIPIISIISELIFAFGGILILLSIFGFQLLIFNLPVLIVLIVFSRFVSIKLKRLGQDYLKFTEKRLNSIDNISEIALELSALNNPNYLVDYFEKTNKPFNKVLSQQIVTSNMTQIYTESASFIIILICLICLITNIAETSLANSATSLAILARMVPSFTRSISFFAQLQFGVPSVKRLSQMYKNKV